MSKMQTAYIHTYIHTFILASEYQWYIPFRATRDRQTNSVQTNVLNKHLFIYRFCFPRYTGVHDVTLTCVVVMPEQHASTHDNLRAHSPANCSECGDTFIHPSIHPSIHASSSFSVRFFVVVTWCMSADRARRPRVARQTTGARTATVQRA